MDRKPDSQKRPLCELDDTSLICPDCKDLEEHTNKKCPKQLLTQTTDSSKTMDAAAEKVNKEKRPCYRCEDCRLTFSTSQNLEYHLKENCLSIPVVYPNRAKISYEECMNILRSAMQNEQCYLNSLSTVRDRTTKAIKRYASAIREMDCAHKTYTEATVREQKLCTLVTPEEQNILSHLAARYRHNLKAARWELEKAGTEVDDALHIFKNHNHIAMCAATKVHFTYSEAFTAFREQRFDSSKPKDEDKELKKIKDVLQQRHRILMELQDGANELDASVTLILEIEEEPRRVLESGRDSAQWPSGSGGDHASNTKQETADDTQPSPMDVTKENLDDPRPSTSRD